MELREVTGALFKTVSDQTCWADALEHLCNYTKADKALISLRDRNSARIVIPTDVSEEFASPLIYGFSEAEVAAFLQDFESVDPWTEIERQNHPYFPYAMSRYLDRSALRQTEFWEWLEPQGINDCVVCELGQFDAFWAALNVYFHAPGDEKSRQVVERVRNVLPVLKDAWSAGREFQIAKAMEGSLDMVLAVMDVAAVLLGRDRQVVAINDLARDMFSGWTHDLSVGDTLSLPANIPLVWDDSVPQFEVPRRGVSDIRLRAEVAAFVSSEREDGEAHEYFLMTIAPFAAGASERGAPIWDAQSLTDRERVLVRLVAEGRKFREAQQEMGISYPRVMQLWKSARDKLDLTDVTDLRLTHRLSQNSNRL